jgi:hypothetical protein
MSKALNNKGIRTIYLAAGVKNKIVERMIQEARAVIRCIRASRRYVIPRNLDCELWMAAANHLANTPNKRTGYQTTPFFLMTGRKPTLWPYEFGEVGIVHSPRADDPSVRAEWGIFIGIDSEFASSLRIYIPSRGLVYSRKKFEPQESRPKSWGYQDRITEMTTADMMKDDDILRQHVQANDYRSMIDNISIQGGALTGEDRTEISEEEIYNDMSTEDTGYTMSMNDRSDTRLEKKLDDQDDNSEVAGIEMEDNVIADEVISNMNDTLETATEIDNEMEKMMETECKKMKNLKDSWKDISKPTFVTEKND